jgi:hypothetical protein
MQTRFTLEPTLDPFRFYHSHGNVGKVDVTRSTEMLCRD